MLKRRHYICILRDAGIVFKFELRCMAARIDEFTYLAWPFLACILLKKFSMMLRLQRFHASSHTSRYCTRGMIYIVFC